MLNGQCDRIISHLSNQVLRDRSEFIFESQASILEDERESRATLRVVIAVDGAAMRDHDLATECQANTAAIPASRKKRDEYLVHDVV